MNKNDNIKIISDEEWNSYVTIPQKHTNFILRNQEFIREFRKMLMKEITVKDFEEFYNWYKENIITDKIKSKDICTFF